MAQLGNSDSVSRTLLCNSVSNSGQNWVILGTMAWREKMRVPTGRRRFEQHPVRE